VSASQRLNIQSLNLVQEELVSAIEAAARELESFVASNQEDSAALQACIDGVQQISGIFKMLELKGASTLVDELLLSLNEIPSGANGKSFDKKMEAISTTFFVVSRYIEFLLHSKNDIPSLLIPHINALKKLRHEDLLQESHFVSIGLPKTFEAPKSGSAKLNSDTFRGDVKRMRHMYQIGLSGILREKQVTKSLAFMRRSMRRMRQLGGDESPLSLLWWLADSVLGAFSKNNMSLWEARKFLFMRIEKLYRQIEQGGNKALAANAPKGLIKELVYLYALSGEKPTDSDVLAKTLSAIKLGYTEIELQREHSILYGPSAHTISSLSHVLRTELSSAKKTLENASQDAVGQLDDHSSFVSLLESIAGTLDVVGFKNASNSLREQVVNVKAWSENPEEGIDNASIAEVAETLLYLDSLVQEIDSADLSSMNMATGSNTERKAHVASHEFTTAIHVVIEESLGALSLTKRALNSFSDSGYDTGHIKNISKTLNSVRGAMELLKQDRVANVVGLCAEFVDEVLSESDLPAAIDEVLETFADAIMAVEFYLDSAKTFENMDESVLVVAEESLTALGFTEEGE